MASRTRSQPKGVERAEKKKDVAQRYMPCPRECALLLLHLIEAKEHESGRAVSRFRISELSVKRLWLRAYISADFTAEVANWLARAGVTLCHVGSAYIVVRSAVIESWLRITSKRLSSDLLSVAAGSFDFSELERLMVVAEGDDTAGD